MTPSNMSKRRKTKSLPELRPRPTACITNFFSPLSHDSSEQQPGSSRPSSPMPAMDTESGSSDTDSLMNVKDSVSTNTGSDATDSAGPTLNESEPKKHDKFKENNNSESDPRGVGCSCALYNYKLKLNCYFSL